MANELNQTQPGDFIGMFDALVRTGLVSFGVNEVNLRSLIDDPPKYTLESKSGALGGWSARYVIPNGSAVELVLVQFKKDERTRGRDDVLWGEWTIHIKGAETPTNPDGMVLVFLCLHDYIWIKGISADPYPMYPPVTLPPVPAPPADPWLTPPEQVKHAVEIQRIQDECAPMPLDEGRVNAYMQGRNRNLAEVHDDEVFGRAGLNPDPCNGVNRIPL